LKGDTFLKPLQELLARSAASHHNLCPRQVLGVRMGMLAGKTLGLDLPQEDKRLFAFVECDGCGMGGIAAATGCLVERRTMRVLDYGKLAATFVDTQTGRAIRITPKPECREIAEAAVDGSDRWHKQLEAYQVLPDEDLFAIQPVKLSVSLEAIISQASLRVCCEACGEEVTNEREVLMDGKVLCSPCAGNSYYKLEGSLAGQGSSRNPIPLITVIGKSKGGKMVLVEKLIRELTERGLKIAAVKRHFHEGFEIDHEGKDSWRYARAGSQQVVIAAPDKFATYRQLDQELSLDEIAAGISGVDLILVDGYMSSNKPSIEVVRSENGSELIGAPEQWIAIASEVALEAGVPVFELDDIQGISSFIQTYLKNIKVPQ
jgi:formylmethanofuran dehydrogenase subunit E